MILSLRDWWWTIKFNVELLIWLLQMTVNDSQSQSIPKSSLCMIASSKNSKLSSICPVVLSRYLHLLMIPWVKAENAAWGWVFVIGVSSLSSAAQLLTLVCKNKSFMSSGPNKDPTYALPSVVTCTPLSVKMALVDSR